MMKHSSIFMIIIFASPSAYGMHRNVQPATTPVEKGAPMHRAVPEMTAAKIDALRTEAETKIKAIETADHVRKYATLVNDAQAAIEKVPAPSHHLLRQFDAASMKGLENIEATQARATPSLFRRIQDPANGITPTVAYFTSNQATPHFRSGNSNRSYTYAVSQAPNDVLFNMTYPNGNRVLNFKAYAVAEAALIDSIIRTRLETLSRAEVTKLKNSTVPAEVAEFNAVQTVLQNAYTNLMNYYINSLGGLNPAARRQEVLKEMDPVNKAIGKFKAAAVGKGFTIN